MLHREEPLWLLSLTMDSNGDSILSCRFSPSLSFVYSKQCLSEAMRGRRQWYAWRQLLVHTLCCSTVSVGRDVLAVQRQGGEPTITKGSEAQRRVKWGEQKTFSGSCNTLCSFAWIDYWTSLAGTRSAGSKGQFGPEALLILLVWNS